MIRISTRRTLSRAIGAIGVIGVTSLAGALAACAESDEAQNLDGDGGPSVQPAGDDAGDRADADAGPEASAPPAACSPGGWCHTALPPKTTLTGVWGDGAGVVWAIADDGRLLRWESNAWKVHATGLGALRAIWGSGPTDIWLSNGAALLHGVGASPSTLAFTEVETPGDADATITCIWGTGPDDVWAVGGRADIAPYAGRVLHYAAGDAGAHAWTSLDDFAREPMAFSHVWGSAASGVWISGVSYDEDEWSDVGVILRRPAGGADFAAEKLPEDTIYTGSWLARVGGVSTTGTVTTVVGTTSLSLPASWRAISTDNGATFTWTYKNGAGGEFPMNAAFTIAADDAWSAGEYGRLRHWDGAEWTQAAVTTSGSPLTMTFNAMWGAPSKDLWVVGDGIAVRRDLSK
ncbi:MAG: hypothetical protein KF764_11775 [Labilithrix sp.]|nr:hypothetical protein [Labilithrix sp.]MBX3225558.1 hypothetical protein [Labilithrix sp.]